MTRVLVIDAAGNLWGSERSLLDMLAAAPDLDVAVCCPPGRPLTVELASRGTRTLPYYVYGLHEKSRGQRIRAAIGVLRACLTFRPDVIHLNQGASYKIALHVAKLLGIPMVAHVRIFEDAAYLARQRPDPELLRGLIAISGAVESEIKLFPELSSIRLHRIYDTYVGAVGSSVSSEARVADRIACVGRLVPIKGQDLLIRALGLLKHDPDPPECLIIGDGSDDFIRELKQLASNEGLDAWIRWPGYVHDIGPLLRTCSVLACPSHREPLGRVIFDAWDAGAVPVVFAGSGGAAEIVVAADGGMIYEEQTPESLAGALRSALELNGRDAARLVDNGRSWMARNCDPVQYGRAISAILADAGEPGRHAS